MFPCIFRENILKPSSHFPSRNEFYRFIKLVYSYKKVRGIRMTLKKLCHQNRILITAVMLCVMVTLGVACSTNSGTATGTANSESDGLVIRYLTAPQQIAPLRGTEILCVVTDKSGGKLNYEWSSSGGEIKHEQEPQSIKWFAPEKTGSYTISVVVTNSQGAQVNRSVTIVVSDAPDEHPVIHSVTCDDCKYRTEASKLSQYAIKCEAIDPNGDELKYTWFANLGRIKGEGPVVEWFTGSQFGNALITVIVTDSKGNETEGHLAINISCCN
jgi:hypothetical protein